MLLQCISQGIFSYWRSLQGRGTFDSMSQGKPQQLLWVNTVFTSDTAGVSPIDLCRQIRPTKRIQILCAKLWQFKYFLHGNILKHVASHMLLVSLSHTHNNNNRNLNLTHSRKKISGIFSTNLERKKVDKEVSR